MRKAKKVMGVGPDTPRESSNKASASADNAHTSTVPISGENLGLNTSITTETTTTLPLLGPNARSSTATPEVLAERTTTLSVRHERAASNGPFPSNGTSEKYGLFVFKDQPDIKDGVVDIIALHGLNGDYESTWVADDTGANWLKDEGFLPDQAVDTRIMSYGYNSQAQLSKSVAGIGAFAEGLLAQVASRRRSRQEKRRPIVFICHSLGGIVVKKAFIVANEQDRFKDLLSCFYGIAFLGTPHQGSKVADWAKIIGTIAKYASAATSTNDSLLKSLKKGSPELFEISKSFIDRSPTLSILSFFELDKLPRMNFRVVPEDSAILRLPNEQRVPVNADHFNICKFARADENRYRDVWTALQDMIVAAREKVTSAAQKVNQADDDRDMRDLEMKMALPAYPNTLLVTTKACTFDSLDTECLSSRRLKSSREELSYKRASLGYGSTHLLFREISGYRKTIEEKIANEVIVSQSSPEGQERRAVIHVDPTIPASCCQNSNLLDKLLMLKQAFDDPDGTAEPGIFDARPLYGYSEIEHAIEKLETSGETQSSADGQGNFLERIERLTYEWAQICGYCVSIILVEADFATKASRNSSPFAPFTRPFKPNEYFRICRQSNMTWNPKGGVIGIGGFESAPEFWYGGTWS
ncbi:hypothetical protein AYO21_11824 [Fonsecaea monophora]|uniref:DUF676 domain-containing protein n=1 Tax=Fonsecaea monophora TaxID=254056 RepID=A0A177ERE7_9EURO|nr:hypothetical protein AYO21_11824 [Fonsecaea monophora]OAG34031.1 hypothetical protein AYO21_11824 [Fonsecaea monophora]